ncbi:MAG: bifunctional DNA-formamidopyrimidine glycosylase/DNA-(apurinic or apyrimidinic site) lyase [Gemmatimonadaceae bacterium]
MPELPETETIARDLNTLIAGRAIVGLVVTNADVLREVSAEGLAERTVGTVVSRVWRRAKLVVLDLSGGDRIVVQPRFTGALLLDDGDLPDRERRYSTMEIQLDDRRSLHYRDIRRLGTVSLMANARFASYTQRLGVEPLDADFTIECLSQILRASRQSVKKVLMDQRRMVGVGNIYANEALWRARVDPSRAAGSLGHDDVASLHDALVTVLRESIAARGTSFRDYRDARGAAGAFAAQLRAYGRAGQQCARCGGRLVGTHAVDGRMTVFCARCQR